MKQRSDLGVDLNRFGVWIVIVLWAIPIVIALGSIIYLGFMVYDVLHDVKAAPRTSMFVCDKHGMIPSKYVLHSDMSGVLEKPQEICPFCWEDAIKKAREKYGHHT